MEYDEDKIDDVVLALLTLTLHDASEFGGRAWKGHDWAVMDRLHEKGYIHNPKGKAKSVFLTRLGLERAYELFDQFFGKGEEPES